MNRTIVAALLALTAMVVVEPASRAQELTPSALRTAAVSFGPLPTSSLFTPETFHRIEEMARAAQWALPDEGPVWQIEQGMPVVQTRQVDELWHEVHEKQSVGRLRGMFKASTRQLRDLNPDLELDSLEGGELVLAWQRDASKVSQSIGAANRGRLRYGEPLPEGNNYEILYPHRTFGTYYTVSEIVRVMDAYAEKFPTAHPLMIGDISFRTGRRIRPHKSHQSGRDVDISYPRLNPPPNYKRFHHVRRSNLDARRTLWLLKQFIDGGNVEYIFMDRYLQREVYKEAKRQGAPEEWLAAVFQYPHWRGGRALIRHSRGHRNHFHIRFKCQETDRRCR